MIIKKIKNRSKLRFKKFLYILRSRTQYGYSHTTSILYSKFERPQRTNNHHAEPSSSASQSVGPPSCVAQPHICTYLHMRHRNPYIPPNYYPLLPCKQHNSLFAHATSEHRASLYVVHSSSIPNESCSKENFPRKFTYG